MTNAEFHIRLRTAVEARLEVARAAADVEGYFTISTIDGEPAKVDAVPLIVHINNHRPAAVIRLAEALLRVLDRHAPRPRAFHDLYDERHGKPWCSFCDATSPCPDIRDLAAGEGIEVGE